MDYSATSDAGALKIENQNLRELERMINKVEWDRMIAGELYNPYKVGDHTFETIHIAQKKFNECIFGSSCKYIYSGSSNR